MANLHPLKFRIRFLTVLAAVVVLMGILVARLMALQLRDGEEYLQSSQTKITKELTLTGSRGKIVDRNGVVLAYDKESYNVAFYRDPSRNKKEDLAEYSRSLLTVLDIVQSNGFEMVDDCYFRRDENGALYFDFGTADEEVAARREATWRSNFYLKKELGVQECYDKLVERYGLEEMDADTQLKLLALWQQLQMNAFLSKPVPIAYDVNMTVVSMIEAQSVDLVGVSIEESTVRVYPFGSLAAHVIGYCGKMTDEATLNAYVEKGYSPDALVGVTGIEYTMEEQLSANVAYRQGSSLVERDANGSVTRELEYEAPTDGNTVVLTLDIGYQQVLEEALNYNIATTNQEQHIKYDSYTDEQKAVYEAVLQARKADELNMANSGAAVVLDVNTCEVLAMASSPSYDLNWFVGGISNEDYKVLVEDKRAPLFNRAVSSRSTPGSIFKMLTGLAGLADGKITTTEIINDEGYYQKYITSSSEKGPSCWVRPYFNRHTNQTIVEAVKDSCNYYFFETASRIGIDTLSYYADLMGLTSKTGIELASEVTSVVGSQGVLYDPNLGPYEQKLTKANAAARAVRKIIVQLGEDLGIQYDDERVDRTVDQLMDLAVTVDTSEQTAAIHAILMEELSLSSREISSNYLGNKIGAYLQEVRWTANETILTGIGQSITELTPVAVARYIAAVANGGTVYEVQMVDKVLSPTGGLVMDKEKVVFKELSEVNGAIPGYLETIREGMHGVISTEDGGTAAKYFTGYPYTDEIGAKTGTAQVNNIEIEDNAWFCAFAPYDDPEICVVVFIPNGYSGGLSSLTAKDVFTHYFESQEKMSGDQIAQPGQMLP